MFKIEKTTLNVSLVYLFLMFGYKLFSLFYPLFLVSVGLSVVKIGSVYLLIYGTIAVASVAVNFFIHKVNPAIVASLGILGYAIYSLLMFFPQNMPIFYFAQILLGISAALWLVSLRSILITSRPRNYNVSFGWFYASADYASAIAPAVGALVIWKFGFVGVFTLSFFIQILTSFFCYVSLKDSFWPRSVAKNDFGVENLKERYGKFANILKKDGTLSFAMITIFTALMLVGAYRTFFILFLKDAGYDQDMIIKFASIISLAYAFLSLAIIRIMGRWGSAKNINYGVAAKGVIGVVLGLGLYAFNVVIVFILVLLDSLTDLVSGSGKSSLLAEKFKNFKEEAATFDTVLTQSGTAMGGLLGGLVISFAGYSHTFIIFSIIILMFSAISFLLALKKSGRYQ